MSLDLSVLAARVAKAGVSSRLLLFTLSLVSVLFLATGLLRTQFDGTFNALITESDPYLDELVRMDEEFPLPTEASFLSVANETDSVFNRATLSALADLHASYETIPKATYVSSIINWMSPET